MKSHLSISNAPMSPSNLSQVECPTKLDSGLGAHRYSKQRGVVLFLTLVALLAMSLAAVALIRSVDTSSLITGNLAFKQATTSSAEMGINAAMSMMAALRNANLGKKIKTDPSHPLNQTNLAINRAYHSSLTPGLDLFADATWSSTHASLPVTDRSGNEFRYIIQRMCRLPNVELDNADCLVNSRTLKNSDMRTPDPTKIYIYKNGQPAQVQVTVRARGPNNSLSYVQGYVY